MNRNSQLVAVTDASSVGEVRRAAQLLTARLDFSETTAGQVSIVVTELAGNLVKHAGGGEILLRELGEGRGIEILSLDNGKGMVDIGRCLEDGYSTAGSPGTGLGAIQRLSNVFDIYSYPGKGTVIMSQLWLVATGNDYEIGAICIPYPGEKVCGDGWGIHHANNMLKILMVDGLGHGPYAAEAADAALQVFYHEAECSPTDIIKSIHGALRSTRGAAAAVVEIGPEKNVRFAGVGNISGFVYGGPKERGLASYNGTLGHQLHKIQELTLPWLNNGLIILHSDGLGTRWKLDDYPGLRQRHPALIAGILYRDYCRGRDDVTILVMRET